MRPKFISRSRRVLLCTLLIVLTLIAIYTLFFNNYSNAVDSLREDLVQNFYLTNDKVTTEESRTATNTVPAVKGTEKGTTTSQTQPQGTTTHVKGSTKSHTQTPTRSVTSKKSSTLPAPTLTTKTGTNSTTRFITIRFQGRLGNLLFQYASLIGIARHNKLIPLIPMNNQLRRSFQITTGNTESKRAQLLLYKKNFGESHGGCTFDARALVLGSRYNVILDGYYQSFKYFTNSIEELRKQFTFKDSVIKTAKSQFSQITSDVKQSANMVFIAVHLRRGDMVSKQHYVKYGYISPGLDYMNKAINAFRANYTERIFIVASDDIPWCKANIKGNDVRYIQQRNPPDVDMAIMAQCQHMVMSVGSFGWWTAWLINGTTIYYKDYPRANSNLAKEFTSQDYRPPHWIPM